MKHRGLLIFGWFAVLLIYNAASHWSENANKNLLFVLLQAIGYITTPMQLILSAVVVSGIILSKRKPMSER
jgi:Na+/citrate or Na+/malate symporter